MHSINYSTLYHHVGRRTMQAKQDGRKNSKSASQFKKKKENWYRFLSRRHHLSFGIINCRIKLHFYLSSHYYYPVKYVKITEKTREMDIDIFSRLFIEFCRFAFKPTNRKKLIAFFNFTRISYHLTRKTSYTFCHFWCNCWVLILIHFL